MPRPAANRRRPRRGSSLPPNVCRHRGRYRGKLMVNGRSHVGPSLATPEEAAEWVQQLRDVGAASQDNGPLTLGGAMDLLRREQAANGVRAGSTTFTEWKFNALRRAWPDDPGMHRIGAAQIHSYMEHRRKKDGVSVQTLHHEVALLKRLFAIGKKHRLLTRSPFDDGVVQLPRKVTNKRFDHLPREQVETLLLRVRAAGEKDADMQWAADVCEFLFLTGLRRSEFARLRVEDVDVFKGAAKVLAKTENEQVVRLHERHKAVVARLIAAADEDGYLVRAAGKTERSRVDRIAYVMATVKRRFGLELHGALHVLRHSYGTALVRSGVPLPLVQRAMRHKTVAMTMRYFHETEDDMRAVAEAIATGRMPDLDKPARKPKQKARAKAKKTKAETNVPSAPKPEAM